MSYRDESLPPVKRVRALLAAADSRGALKRLGRWLDTEGLALKAEVVIEARRQGVDLPDEAKQWPGKRLLRRGRAREAESRLRKNPIAVNEAFICAACARAVPPAGSTARNHCPHCLRSLHVDVVPGDRAASCGGIMDPVSAGVEGRAGIVLLLRCRSCGHERRNRALRDPPGPDDAALLHRLLSGEAVEVPRERGDTAAVRSFRAQVLEAFRGEASLAAGQRVAVAVSGGVDSVVLLDVMTALQHALGITLVVATVDHALRPDAVADVVFVRSLAAARGLPVYSGRISVGEGAGIADAARAERYAFLASVPVDRVLLAQHADDQAETVLLRVLRGTGVRGLGAMRARRGRWVRPLLERSRAEILRYARDRGLTWREDPSNADRRRERARVRLEVMPLLDDIHGDARGTLASLARSAREQWELVEAAFPDAWARTATPWGLSRSALLKEPLALRAALIERVASEAYGLTQPLARSRVDAIGRLAESGEPGRYVELGRGWRMAVSTDALHVLPPPPETITLPIAGRWRWGAWTLVVTGVPSSANVEVRPVARGELFGGRPVHEALRVMGLPAPLRPYHPMVWVDGVVAWVPGVGRVGESGERGLGLSVQGARGLRCGGLGWRVTL